MRGSVLFPACLIGVMAFSPRLLASVSSLSSTTTAPTSQPVQCTFSAADLGLCFSYPATWMPEKAATARFDVAAPPCPSHAYADLCLDVPHLPPHFAWMISAKRVEDGYVKNLRSTTLPDAHVDESLGVLVNGCQQARRVKCSGHNSAGTPTCDVAVIGIRNGAVYIFSCESNPPGEQTARFALDEALATLTWAH